MPSNSTFSIEFFFPNKTILMRLITSICAMVLGVSQVACAKDDETSPLVNSPPSQSTVLDGQSPMANVDQLGVANQQDDGDGSSQTNKYQAPTSDSNDSVTPETSKLQQFELGDSIMIVLDSSGSMWGQIDGVPKRDIARQALRNVLSTLPSSAQIGLTAYGHRRKGDCTDIEVLAQPGMVDRLELANLTDSLSAIGKTPLTAAVREAANALARRGGALTVVLITDGVETCDANPCALGRELKENQVGLKTHVIGFGLSGDEGRQVSCLAKETGGLYFDAHNAKRLSEALDTVVDDLVSQEEKSGPATVILEKPSVLAGSVFSVQWSGPKNPLDSLTVLSADGEKEYGRFYVYRDEDVSPATVTAPETKGEYAVHYLTRRGKSLANATFSVTPAPASVTVITNNVATDSEVEIDFTGPKNRFDKIILIDPSTHEVLETRFVHRLESNRFTFQSPARAGVYHIKYLNNDATMLASAELPVTKQHAQFTVPDSPIIAGARFKVAVKNDAGATDALQVIRSQQPDNVLSKVFLKQRKNGLVTLMAPLEVGSYEVVYVDRDKKILDQSSLSVVAPPATMEVQQAPVKSGESFQILVSSKHGEFDKIEIIETNNSSKPVSTVFVKSAKDGKVKIRAPKNAGTYTLQYIDAGDVIHETQLLQVDSP